jgi:hypothetical protein
MKPWISATMSPFIILFRREAPSHKITRKKKKMGPMVCILKKDMGDSKSVGTH